MGRALGQLWCYSEAGRVLRRAARLLTEFPKVQAVVWRDYGHLYLRAGRLGAAQPYYERALASDSGSARTWLALGACQAMQGKWQSAHSTLAQGLRRRTELSWENHYWMGWVLRAQERFAEAGPYLRRGSEMEAEDCRRIGVATSDDRGPACQLAWGRKQSQSHPDEASAYFLQASALSEMGRLRAALAALRKAWRLIPLETYKWSSLGLIYANCNRFSQAADCYQRCHSSQYPGNWLIRSGLLRARTGHTALAQDCLERGLAQETTYRDQGHLGLGQIYCGLNRLEEAEMQFRHALDCNPDNQDAYLALTDVHLAMAASL